MKKRIAMILALVMLAACSAAAADGIAEISAITAEPGGAAYTEGDWIDINDRETTLALWDAVKALAIGEKTEALADGINAKLGFWFKDQSSADLFFAGRTLKTAEGEYYTLQNDEALWAALAEMTDHYRLTVKIDGYAFTLGESTPQDLIDTGACDYVMEEDGTISFSCDEGESWIYIRTEHGRLDEPILTVNAFWAETYIDYCGFDGIYSIGWLDDPDAIWSTDGYTVDERDDLIENGEMSGSNQWEGLGLWLTERFGAEESEEGITEAKIPLSDGRTVYVSTHGTPVRISLLPD